MAEEYDVIVLGGGPAGENVAGRCAEGGLRTALVERELLGGETSYWADLPTKAMLRPGAALLAAVRVPGARQAITGDVDAAAALAFRDAVVAGWDDQYQLQSAEEAKIHVVRGHARLLGARQVEVETEDGPIRLQAQRAVVLATGSSAAPPVVRGLTETRVWDNRDATETQAVPDRLIVLGGGRVGCELAQAFRRLGSRRVTVVEAAQRLLPSEEPFAGDQVRAAFEGEGILVYTGATAVRVFRQTEDEPITAVLHSGQSVTADELVVAVGRSPNTWDLGVETAGLRPGTWVDVDGRLRATGVADGWLYAVGDVNGRDRSTHFAKYQARLAADDILGRPPGAPGEAPADPPPELPPAPRLVFTDPQVAAVGMTEAQAQDAGVEARVVACTTDSVPGATVLGEGITGTCQLIVDSHRGIVIGATFTGPGVVELIHAATVAIVGEVPLERLRHAVAPFPTLSEVWLKLVEGYRAATG